MTKLVRRLSAVVLPLLILVSSAQAADTTPGLVKEKPSQGRFIKTDQGYMVEYKIKIPNSNVSITMIPVPGGSIKIGSPASEKKRDASEGPQFTVKTPPFWIQKYEVSWAQYKQYMALHDIFKSFETHKMRVITKENKAAVITAPSNLYDTSFTYRNGEDPKLPACTMSQYAAKQYTKWLSHLTGEFYRLPGEAEWEYACRAGKDTPFSFGSDASKLGEYGWFFDNSNETAHYIGLKKPNPWGLYDMHGNVAEWVLDGYEKDGHKKFAGKTVDAKDAVIWSKKLYPRVCKGGNWDLDPHQCRSAARFGSKDDDWRTDDPNIPLSPWWFTAKPSLGVGFRIIRPLTPPATKERSKYWEADLKQIIDDVNYRIDDEGRGARGFIDKDLPKAIKKVEKLDDDQ